MATVHVSASQAVRRIVKGDTLSLYFTTNGTPLFQGLQPDTYTVSPAWTESGTHPEITPHVGSARKNAVTLTNHKWSYNGTEITWASGTGWVKSTNFSGVFKLNTTDGTIAIVSNLASKTNQDSDILTYSGTAMLAESSYQLEKSVDILVSMLGGSSYFGGVNLTSSVLSNDVSSTTLTAWLFNGSGGNVSTYSCKVYRGSESSGNLAATFNSGNSVSIHREQANDDDKLYVDSHQLFIVAFLVNSNVVYRCGVSVDDIADLYQLSLYSTGEVDESSNQVFRCKIAKSNNNGGSAEVTPSSATVTWNILDNNMAVKRTATQSWATMNSSGFPVKATDTEDDDGNIIGITVNCDVEATF